MFPFALPLQFLRQRYTYPEISSGRAGVCSLFPSNCFYLAHSLRCSYYLHVPVPGSSVTAVAAEQHLWKYMNFNVCSIQVIPEFIKLQTLCLFLLCASAFWNKSSRKLGKIFEKTESWLSAQIFFFLWLSLWQLEGLCWISFLLGSFW